MTDSDDGSDLDLDIEELARRPAPSTSKNVPPTLASQDLIIESNDDEEIRVRDKNKGTNKRYGFRKRTPIIYDGFQSSEDESGISDAESSDDDEFMAKKLKKNFLHLSRHKLKTFIKDPNKIEELGEWILNEEIVVMEKEEKNILEKFVERCGKYLSHLVVVWEDVEVSSVLNFEKHFLDLILKIFNNSKNLSELTIKYTKASRKDAKICKILQKLYQAQNTSLCSLTLLGDGEESCIISEDELKIILQLQERGRLTLKYLEIGDFLWETGVPYLQKLLEVGNDSLTSLTIHGGLVGISKDAKFVLNFPKSMRSLKELSICPKYSFVSEMKENAYPSGKRWRVIKLDDAQDEENSTGSPLKLILCLEHTEFPSLFSVVLGNLVELQEFGFAFVRKLKLFKCGSRWDLAIRLPGIAARPSWEMEQLQFPDALKDPSFIRKISIFFPNLKAAWIYLPSVAVLRTFFKCYGTSETLEELNLKTQYDFETSLESCLLPHLAGGEDDDKLSDESRTAIQTLKEYKHFEDFVRYHNIEMPLEEEEDLRELRESSSGIRALKSLQVLDIEHIPRKLFIPNPEDDRRWYDHNFKYMQTTFGFENYPFSKKCHKEISKMKLKRYSCKNFELPRHAAEKYDSDLVEYDAMFVRERRGNPRKRKNSKQSKTGSGAKVAIKPSMLLQNHFSKDKMEH